MYILHKYKTPILTTFQENGKIFQTTPETFTAESNAMRSSADGIILIWFLRLPG